VKKIRMTPDPHMRQKTMDELEKKMFEIVEINSQGVNDIS
jgi:hypothetical protein